MRGRRETDQEYAPSWQVKRLSATATEESERSATRSASILKRVYGASGRGGRADKGRAFIVGDRSRTVARVLRNKDRNALSKDVQEK